MDHNVTVEDVKLLMRIMAFGSKAVALIVMAVNLVNLFTSSKNKGDEKKKK